MTGVARRNVAADCAYPARLARALDLFERAILMIGTSRVAGRLADGQHGSRRRAAAGSRAAPGRRAALRGGASVRRAARRRAARRRAATQRRASGCGAPTRRAGRRSRTGCRRAASARCRGGRIAPATPRQETGSQNDAAHGLTYANHYGGLARHRSQIHERQTGTSFTPHHLFQHALLATRVIRVVAAELRAWTHGVRDRNGWMP